MPTSNDPNPIRTAVQGAAPAQGGPLDFGSVPGPTAQQPTSVANPIGVPYYRTDPNTGQPQLYDPVTGRLVTVFNGKNVYADTGEPFEGQPQPLRWAANPQVPNDTNVMGDQGQLVHAGGQVQSIPPRYFDGEQFMPASLPPDQIVSLQKALVSAGILQPGQAQLGVWDQASTAAYEKVLTAANVAGTDWSTALYNWTARHQANPNSDGRAPLTVKVSNPDDLKLVFRKAVIDTLGQGWDQAKIDQMVNAYQGVETAAQYQQYAATGSGSQTDPGTGGTVTAPPSPQAFAETQARKEDPTHAQEHDTLGMVDAFNQLVGKWNG